MFENKQETKQEHQQVNPNGEHLKFEREGPSPANAGDGGDHRANSHDALHGEQMPHRPDLVEQGRLEQKNQAGQETPNHENSHHALGSPEQGTRDVQG